jgi:flagellar protein FliO/FliZ
MSALSWVAIILGAAAAAAAVWYIYLRKQGEMFTPRERRLGYVERASIDGGRKLVLIRRDNVEHLLLIGGPLDLVIETGIPTELQPSRREADHAFAGAVQSFADTARGWQRSAKNGSAEPSLSLAADAGADAEDAVELTPARETKLAK